MRFLLFCFSLVLLPLEVACQSLPTASPESAGMSADVLAEIHPAMQRYVEEDTAPGILTLVARRGTVVQAGTYGWRNREAQEPMTTHTLFRLHSMTKPLTSVAVLMLYEQGKIDLDASVATYLPAFANQQVIANTDGDQLQFEATERPMTIRDLLTHTAGLGGFGPNPISDRYQETLSQDFASVTEMAEALATLPLLHQPGATWTYGYSTDVLAAVIEVVSGQSFRDFLRQKILLPLGMNDTDYWVPASKKDRLSAKYVHTVAEGRLPFVHPPTGVTTALFESPEESPFLHPPSLYQGATGLVGTAPDYLRFAQMLLNGGALEGVRLLRPETVDLMFVNQLPDSLLPISVGVIPFPGPGVGFGLGGAVMLAPGNAMINTVLSPGSFWWQGAGNTYFWIDPQEEIIGLLMTQLADFGSHDYYPDFQRLVYDAIQQPMYHETTSER